MFVQYVSILLSLLAMVAWMNFLYLVTRGVNPDIDSPAWSSAEWPISRPQWMQVVREHASTILGDLP